MMTKEELDAAKGYVTGLLDSLPIFAAQVGIRGSEHEAGESTPEEVALMHALFKVSDTWQEVRPTG